ncbi:MAG TPA: cellulose biosynthesis cyclic di-GMP-binding regulatory protein BcsB [Usitatibacter sp.]|nr:cellulose biosynthesis cyclic di-GMP-binding regulatory protein BcsB [Usitatibacter sp.]
MNGFRCAAACLIVASLPAAADSRTSPFTHFGASQAIVLAGDGATAAVGFGQRNDELATRATLRFKYTYSTELAPGASQVRLLLNGDVIGNLPVTAEGAGRPLAREVSFDPRLIVGWNKLTLALVAAPGTMPPDPARPGLWFEVNGESELELTVQPLAVADDLALLPEPFFDRHDERRLSIPFVFAAQPSLATLRAAAAVASWIGQLATWREPRFPVQLDAFAPGHSIAFVTNAERPAALASLPAAAGPELRMTTNPGDGRSKLLVVMGRDAEDLRVAAAALVSGKVKLAGAAASIKRGEEPPPAIAYHARAFAAMDRPVLFSELAPDAQQLKTKGPAGSLEPVRVEVRIPPEIGAEGGAGAPLLLRLQYTAPPCATDANLDVSVNDALLLTLPLRLVREPVSDDRELTIPASRLASRVELALAFRFTADGSCAKAPAQGAVLPDSTIDFSAMPHYAVMPNLAHFAAVGYPFTRVADLSETVVVLPQRPATGDIETMLALMGHMGEATGEPTLRVRVASPQDEAAFADADLLVIGAPPHQVLLEKWAGAFPISPRADASPVSERGTGPVAALYGFESPVTAGRSVVVVTAIAPDQMIRVVDAFERRKMLRAIGGAAAFVFPDKVESLPAQRTYRVGTLRPWNAAGPWLSEHLLAVLLIAGMVLAALGVAAWGATRKFAAARAARRPA